MGRVLIKNLEEMPWGQPSPSSFNSERGTRIHIKFVGDRETGPWVLWTRYEPDHLQPAHSHDEDEVIYVLEGEVTVGEARCGPGTAIFVEKDTTYGPLVAGPEGVVFLRVTPQNVEWRP
jgi:quercetin dioxygenase-like cupin family protein